MRGLHYLAIAFPALLWDGFLGRQRREAPQECQWQGATVKLTRMYSQRLLGRFPPLALYHTDVGNAISIYPPHCQQNAAKPAARALHSRLLSQGALWLFFHHHRESFRSLAQETPHRLSRTL
jgi:hypothetical protein